MKILLDSLLYGFEYDLSTHGQFIYFKMVVEFIAKYLEVKYFKTDELIQLFYECNKKPFSEFRQEKDTYHILIQKIMKNMDDETIFIDDVADKCYLPNYPSYSHITLLFNKMLGKILQDDLDCLLFLSINNHNASIEEHQSLHCVNHIYKEIGSYLAKMISNGEHINKAAIVYPSLQNPLPNIELCGNYYAIQKTMIAENYDRISTYTEIGTEVAFRNGYKLSEELTKINNNNGQKRRVFISSQKPYIYLSIDVEHGAIEVFNEKGVHQGEYTYTGEKRLHSQDLNTHKLLLKR